ncbi:HAD hydrolase-like protein [Spirillospora sp. NPDC049652]
MTLPSQIVRSSAVLLLDFDGPVCRLFSGYPASEIAEEIRSFLLDQGTDLPKALHTERDPLALLKWTNDSAPSLLQQVEGIQERGEVRAAESAAPTAHSSDAIESATRSGRPVLIVSNNSARAISHYLKLHQLTSSIASIVGRVPGCPGKMKPDPYSVLKAFELAGSPPSRGVLVGDSITDIEAAHKASTQSIGYAKTETRATQLANAGADAVVDNMAVIAEAFAKSSPEAT